MTLVLAATPDLTGRFISATFLTVGKMSLSAQNIDRAASNASLGLRILRGMAPVSLALRLAAGLCLAGCTSAQGQAADPEVEALPRPPITPPEARATWVETAIMVPSDATLELSLPGEVEGLREAELASSQGGFVEHVRAEVGDEVRKGQLLVKVDTALYHARQGQAGAELTAAKRELARAKKIQAMVAQAELDQAQTRLDAAIATHRVAELQTARASISAPFAGVVAARNAEPGEVASPGVPLMRIVQLDPIKVTLAVSDRDMVSLRVGMPVQVRTDASAQPFTGSILRINPVADTETRSFAVEVEVKNPERRLLPGMIARVTLTQPVATGALVIPQSFLVTRRTDNGVFVNDGGVARWRPLTLGEVVHDQVVVEGGLAVGEEVVVVGQRALADGDGIIVSRKGRCCEDGRVVFAGG